MGGGLVVGFGHLESGNESGLKCCCVNRATHGMDCCMVEMLMGDGLSSALRSRALVRMLARDGHGAM